MPDSDRSRSSDGRPFIRRTRSAGAQAGAIRIQQSPESITSGDSPAGLIQPPVQHPHFVLGLSRFTTPPRQHNTHPDMASPVQQQQQQHNTDMQIDARNLESTFQASSSQTYAPTAQIQAVSDQHTLVDARSVTFMSPAPGTLQAIAGLAGSWEV